MQEGRIKQDHEPFSIRRKEFWDAKYTYKLLSEKFAKQLGHEPDGLIFQPSKEVITTENTPKLLFLDVYSRKVL